MEEEIQVPIASVADIVEAREQGRILGKAVGFSIIDLTIIATAISEIARNILTYAKHGEIILRQIKEGQRNGILIIAQDNGPGIADVSLAMQDGYSTRKGLGLGLPGTKRLMDEFEIYSEIEIGTTVKIKKWLPQNE